MLAGHAGVIGLTAHACRSQSLGQLLHVLAGEAVDDACFTAVSGDHSAHLVVQVAPGLDAIGQVRSIEVTDQDLRVAQGELLADVPLHRGCGRGREGLDGKLGAPGAKLSDLSVLGPEVMSPVTDAVGLIHRQRDHAEGLQALEEALHRQALGGHVEQVESSAFELLVDGAPLFRSLG